jgi:hypothetical protein
VGQAILPAAGFSAGPVKLRIRLEKPAEKPAAGRIGESHPSKEIVAAGKETKLCPSEVP